MPLSRLEKRNEKSEKLNHMKMLGRRPYALEVSLDFLKTNGPDFLDSAMLPFSHIKPISFATF